MERQLCKQCLSCRLDVLVKAKQIFAIFLGAFIVDFEYYLFIVNEISLWKTKKGYIYGSGCKTLISNCAND